MRGDGTGTAGRGLPSTTGGTRGSRSGPTTDAVGWSALFGAISYIGLLAVLNPYIGGSTAYGAGRMLAPAALASVAVWLVARGVSRRLDWWVYALTVPVAAGLLALVTSVDDLRESRDAATSRGEPLGVLSDPGAGEGWTMIDTAATRAEVKRVTEAITSQSEGDVDSVVAQFYTHSSIPNSSVLFFAANGPLDEGRSADRALAALLEGTFVTDPEDYDAGEVGGALGCGEAASQGLEWISCAWVADERAVFLRWDDRTVGLDRAAELTRDLRDRALR